MLDQSVSPTQLVHSIVLGGAFSCCPRRTVSQTSGEPTLAFPRPDRGFYPSWRVEHKTDPSCRRRSSHMISSTGIVYFLVQFG